jgi:hypothetical protein
MGASKTETPDFEKIACDTYDKINRPDDGNEMRAYKAGMEKIWNDYYLPVVREWISVKERPLVTYDELGRWVCTADGEQDFLAALLVHDTNTGKDAWWIRHCIIEDKSGLCVVGEYDNEPAGWEIEDVEFFQPLPIPPKTDVKQNDTR